MRWHGLIGRQYTGRLEDAERNNDRRMSWQHQNGHGTPAGIQNSSGCICRRKGLLQDWNGRSGRQGRFPRLAIVLLVDLVRLERGELDLAIGTEAIGAGIGARPIGSWLVLKFVDHPEFWRRTGRGSVGGQGACRFQMDGRKRRRWRRDRMSGQQRQTHMNPHVTVEADSLIGAERAVRAGVVASTPSNLWCGWTIVQLRYKHKSQFNSPILSKMKL